MVWTEERSQTTYENAAFVRKFCDNTACFRKQGIAVVPAPCAFREWGPLSEELIPNWKGIFENEVTLHETIGLAWYRLRGWI